MVSAVAVPGLHDGDALLEGSEKLAELREVVWAVASARCRLPVATTGPRPKPSRPRRTLSELLGNGTDHSMETCNQNVINTSGNPQSGAVNSMTAATHIGGGSSATVS